MLICTNFGPDPIVRHLTPYRPPTAWPKHREVRENCPGPGKGNISGARFPPCKPVRALFLALSNMLTDFFSKLEPTTLILHVLASVLFQCCSQRSAIATAKQQCCFVPELNYLENKYVGEFFPYMYFKNKIFTYLI